MQRRTFLLSVGGTAIAGGAALGSGAFSQVEADRDVTFTVADDSLGAYLTMRALDDKFATENGTITFNFGDLGADYGDGLNDRAVSSFHSVFEIENAGTNDVNVSYSVNADGTEDTSGAIRLYVANDTTTELDLEPVAAYDSSTTDPAGSVAVGFEIDTEALDTAATYTITITAELAA